MDIIEVIKDKNGLIFLFYDEGVFKTHHIAKVESDSVYEYLFRDKEKNRQRTFDEVLAKIYEFIQDKTCEVISFSDLFKIDPLKESKRLKPYIRDYNINQILD